MSPPTFHRILIANRGEVAVRVARTCDQLGITPVFAVSEADRAAPYTRGREVVVLGPARSASSYLDPVRVVQAAVQGKLTSREGAAALGLSVRQFKRLRAQVRQRGAAGVVPGHRGRPSPRVSRSRHAVTRGRMRCPVRNKYAAGARRAPACRAVPGARAVRAQQRHAPARSSHPVRSPPPTACG